MHLNTRKLHTRARVLHVGVDGETRGRVEPGGALGDLRRLGG